MANHTITAPGGNMYLEQDDAAPMLFAVWSGVGPNNDILGAGDSAEAAIDEAREQILDWGDDALLAQIEALEQIATAELEDS